MNEKINKFLFDSNQVFVDRKLVIKSITLFCIINVLLISPDLFSMFGSNGLVEKNINDVFISQYQPQVHWFTNPLMNLGVSETISTLIFFLA